MFVIDKEYYSANISLTKLDDHELYILKNNNGNLKLNDNIISNNN